MRAKSPDHDGFVDNNGVKIGYEVFGSGPRTVILAPIDPLVSSRAWKAQVPYLSRQARVVTIDPRGTGRSDRPTDAAAFTTDAYVSDITSVLDELDIERALLVCLCTALPTLMIAADQPDRVAGVVSIGTWLPYVVAPRPESCVPFDEELESNEGWRKYNRHYWEHDYPAFLDFYWNALIPEPHSTKQHDDCMEWSLDSGMAVKLANEYADLGVASSDDVIEIVRRVQCPVLAIHGDNDQCEPLAGSRELVDLTGGRMVVLEGSGHMPIARHPVVVNHLIREFLDEVWTASPPEVTTRHRRTTASTRRPRALFLSSPIGLGHARRDLAIAQALRDQRPDVEIDWLTQHPVTELLSRAGETVHPASAHLANESAHVESECGEHDLHAFQALRRMDEIMVNNFMVFDEVVRDGYDLVIGDEAWDVDHFLHENPELKSSTFAWLTDFVGFLPFADGGERETALTRDYNAEMVEHIARAPRVRDRSIFVGDAEDVVPAGLGDGLPSIREWTNTHFEYAGYITGFVPLPPSDIAGIREELGYSPGEQVCIVSVGGSGVGLDLLNRAVAAFPLAKQQIPGLRMVVVTGPRIDPQSLTGKTEVDGLDVRPYVHELWKHLGVCDLGVVQGGLTTTMELVAGRRPFVYVPLRHHFEQQFHVAHRLQRYRAGRKLDFEQTEPERLAQVMTEEIGRSVDYVPVDGGGAARAAGHLAALV